MEKLLLEMAGPALIGGASFGIASLFSISNIEKGLSKQMNTLYFCAIPVFVYVVFRMYFLLLFRLTSIGKFSQLRPIASRTAVFVGLLLAVYGVLKVVPTVAESFQQLYNQNVGDLPNQVLKAGEGQIIKAKYMGERVAGLLVGWFLLLFSFELLLRVLLNTIAFILSFFRPNNQEEIILEKEKEPTDFDLEVKKIFEKIPTKIA